MLIIVGIYLFSTNVVFSVLIRNRERHPAHAFARSAAITIVGSILTIIFFLSGYLDYLLGWQTTYASALFWWSVVVGIVVFLVTFFMTRIQPQKN